MEYLAHAGYLLLLVSYLVTEIMWLRVISIVGGVLTVPFYYFQPGGAVWLSLFWAGSFMLVNAVHVVLLIRARRPVGLPEDARWVYDALFTRMDARAFARLLELGEWIDLEPQQVLISQGEQVEQLMILVRGEAWAVQDGRGLAIMQPGQFVGESAFITGKPASATVHANGRGRGIAWPIERLTAYLEQHAEVAAVVLQVIGVDMATKLHERNLGDDATTSWVATRHVSGRATRGLRRAR